ncbi:MAG: FtsQ-type POTRA domain-containing protein [Clostridia bacterium]|nr:FtsQ-type POTRA domain-containing protein [Clostridia bacterium]
MTQRRQRRPAPRRRRRRQRDPRGKLWIPVLLIALLALWLTLTNYVFVVRNVEVVGTESLSADAVVRASGIRLGSKLSGLDKAVVQSSVDATGVLAYVDVQKRYPVAVRLTVRERGQDAVILQAGKLLVLDTDGYVVSANDSLPEISIPYVTGLKPTTYRLGKQLETTPAKLTAMKNVLEALKTKGVTSYVSELDLEYPSDIKLLTRTGMTVLLGNSDDMENKIAWMAGTLRDLESRGETLGRLDVSSGNKADYLPMVVVTATPVPTQDISWMLTPTPEPTPEPAAEDGAVIGQDAI